MHRLALLAGLLLLASPSSDAQQQTSLTFPDVLARARASAPAVVAARLRIDEARGRVVGVSLPFATNPTLSVEAGPRRGDAATTADYGIEVGQDLEPPSRRRARLDAARAGVTQEEQRAREIERDAVRQVATSFVRAVEARERVEAATTARQLADEALRIAERRFKAGDVARLDVNLARTAVARADGDARAAEATLAGHVTQLKVLLGITAPETVAVSGSLHDALGVIPLDDLMTRAMERPDLRVLDAEIAEAEAEQRLAATLRRPELGLRGSYRREGSERIVLGGVALSLPLFNRGQEASAVAGARLTRLRAEREALRTAIEADVRGAVATYEALRAAAADFERTVIPLVEENETLALESYDVGQIGLADLLVVRRDALDARRSLIDQLIETRLAEVELRARAGVFE
jgi:cobalt-zinc-cadmium efflux system outer membrane protein